MTPRAKEKARKVKTKVKVIKVKVVKLPMLSLMLGLKSNLQQLPLVINPNLNSQRSSPWKTLWHQSLSAVKSLNPDKAAAHVEQTSSQSLRKP